VHGLRWNRGPSDPAVEIAVAPVSGRVRVVAAIAHVAAGAAVLWWAFRCCGPDIANADRGIELLGIPTWILGAALIAYRRTASRVALATPAAWLGIMAATFVVGVYVIAYR
jgi:hypothetical protein